MIVSFNKNHFFKIIISYVKQILNFDSGYWKKSPFMYQKKMARLINKVY